VGTTLVVHGGKEKEKEQSPVISDAHLQQRDFTPDLFFFVI